MTWRTHAVVGANSLWLLLFTAKVDQSIIVYLPIALFASILPDIDATAAKVHYIGGGVLGIFKGVFTGGKYFHHRGIMHSLFVAVLLSFVVWIFSKNYYPVLCYIFGLSYFSHAVIDGFNTRVGYFYPFTTKRFALLPRPLLTPVKGAADKLFFVAAAFGLILFFFYFYLRFSAGSNMMF